MKNILIVCDGIIATYFLETILKLKNIYHNYIIIYQRDETLPNNFEGSNIKLFKFDPTSLERLRNVVSHYEFERYMVVMQDEFEATQVYNNLRSIKQDEQIYFVDIWRIAENFKKDNFLRIIDIPSIISARLANVLPDSQVLADNIGLGIGEITEVKVPIGSSFAYTKIGFFSQSKFHIPMIYRKNNFIVTKASTTIMPNDSLLIVGDPSALRNIYKAIKQEKGQFPSPYGINIYLLIDMKSMNELRISKLIEAAIYLNKTLKNHHLYIKVINPTLFKLNEIKALNNEKNCEVIMDYSDTQISFIKDDTKRYNVGFIVMDNDFFEQYKNIFFELKLPVLTLGNGDINEIKKGVILLHDRKSGGESSVVFDVCGQFGMDVYLYYFDQNINKNKEVVSHYKELSELFKQELYIIDDESKNPIIALSEESNFLQFVPFTQSVAKRGFASNFSKDLDSMYYKLRDNYQLFIPSFYEI